MLKQLIFNMFLHCLTTVVISSIFFSKFVQTSSDGVHNALQQCNATSRGVHVLYNNRKGNDVEAVCLRENMKYRWKFVDGSSTLGERFDPAKDCSEIVDKLPNAQDGFFWVTFNTQIFRKAWCDVHTDGGGFMLVGMKHNPKFWTVPSSSTPVDPEGFPHWSCVLGDVNVQDFRVQFSLDKSFRRTKANWMYRLSPQRKFGNIFAVHNNGCPYLQAGIGNISFVKDLMTQSVLTTNFKCSKFGPHSHKRLGWGRMNYCLQNECKDGYGIIDTFGLKIRYDKFGSFSFSAVSPYSGMNHDSTAFVGCDHDECCACFGPKGGRQNYCGPKCAALNGGRVIKKAFVWFWVRTRMPTRVWKRCMEFTIKSSAGKRVKYYIDRQTGTAYKGTCSEQFEALMNDGTLSVPDKESFEKIPDITGLLTYRADNKQLYVNQGSKWQALSTEEEVLQLNRTLKFGVEALRQRARNQSDIVNGQQNELMDLNRKVEAQNMTIKSEIQILRKLTQFQGNQTRILKNRLTKLESELQGILNAPATCSILRKNSPSNPSGTYYINPKGEGIASLVQVHCDMLSKNGVGVTVIGHDSEASMKVDGFEDAGKYRRKIKYEIPMEQIVSVISMSKFCEQFVKYKCYNAGFWFEGPTSWWVSRQGSQMKYWGGAAPSSGKCACGMTNSCLDRKQKCNCDNNNNVWSEDSGYLTDKNTLPVSELRFGDTSTYNGHNEYGYLTIGRLRCWG